MINSSAIQLENEFTKIISNLGIKNGNNIYVTGDLAALGSIKVRKNEKLTSLLKSFQNNIGGLGTIFSPSASMNLCNTTEPYDKLLTPSHKMGALAEFIRKTPESVRSSHPFWSISGIGPEAHRLNNLSRHAYGVGSVWSHLLDLDTIQVNFGKHPSKAVTLVHHIETVIGVPYRYTKEFLHPIVVNDEIEHQLFYQSVFYSNSDAKKKALLNEHYFEKLESLGFLFSEVHELSGLNFWAFKMCDFYDVALSLFIDNIYNYLEHPPFIRPYTD